jgi:phage shock protein A
MDIFTRIWNLIRANLNFMVSKAEDPEKILEQAVQDMQEELVRMRQAVAQAIATQKRTDRQCLQAQTTSDEWYRRAQLALTKGDESLAREALTRRKSYQETATAMRAQLDQQNQVVGQLRQGLQAVERKLVKTKTDKDLLVARARSAQATQQINDLLSTTNTGGAMDAFNRMEDKVVQLEAQAEVAAEMSTDSLEQKFAALGETADIDAELAAMKNQLVGGAAPTALDPELEKLHREIRGA